MALKFSCADFTFPLLSQEDGYSLIKILGFEGVDIGLFEGRSHLRPSEQLADDIAGNAKSLKDKLEAKGLAPADIFIQIGNGFAEYAVNNPDDLKREKARDIFLRCIEYTSACGCKHITGLPGVHFTDEAKDRSFERCISELAWRCEKAHEANLTFSVEAHVGSIVPTPEETLVLLNDIEMLSLTLDYSHFIKAGITCSRIDPLIRFASHFHARGAAPGKLQTVFRESTIDYANIVKTMTETDYNGFIGIEYTWQEWEDCDRTDNVSETILMKNHLAEKAGCLTLD
ncbi:MAG: sugar phosphate isomerase/epimerase family protein [Saccharofermentanales bacterium]